MSMTERERKILRNHICVVESETYAGIARIGTETID